MDMSEIDLVVIYLDITVKGLYTVGMIANGKRKHSLKYYRVCP